MNAAGRYKGEYTGVKYKPGMKFRYDVIVPENCPAGAALIVDHDNVCEPNANANARLVSEGKAPAAVCIGVAAGRLPMRDGTERGMRMNSYDLFDREYGDFLVYELIPHITEKYSLDISGDPERHLIAGGSSGGISAFLVAWFHPDYFRRVYMSSPSFLAMGRGNEVPYLVRKCETKPLRIYEELSDNEPDDYFGSSYPVGLEIRNALRFAGYDFRFKHFPGEGHCSRYTNEEEALVRLAWLWEDRPTEYENSPRVSDVIPKDSAWERCDTFPDGTRPRRGRCALEIDSADGNLTYGVSVGAVYSYESEESPLHVHAYLHTLPGGIDAVFGLAVDENDRLYVLTDCGIQCVRSFGLIDVILDLPEGTLPRAITISGDMLYVLDSSGVYRRKIRAHAPTGTPCARKCVEYYDRAHD